MNWAQSLERMKHRVRKKRTESKGPGVRKIELRLGIGHRIYEFCGHGHWAQNKGKNIENWEQSKENRTGN